MNKTILSIAVPVYNTDSKIMLRLLKSVIINLKKFKDLTELLIIGNGCSEENNKIILKLLKENKELNIKYKYFNKNIGLNPARNFGIKNTNGKYLWSIDADDIIEENAFKTIINQIRMFDFDILLIRNHRVIDFNNGSVKIMNEKFIKITPIIRIFVFDEILTNSHLETSVWGYVIKRQFSINNDIYYSEASSTDIDISLLDNFIIRNNSVKYELFSKPIYNYIENIPSSNLKIWLKTGIMHTFKVLEHFRKMQEKNIEWKINIDKMYKLIYHTRLLYFIYQIIENFNYLNSKKGECMYEELLTSTFNVWFVYFFSKNIINIKCWEKFILKKIMNPKTNKKNKTYKILLIYYTLLKQHGSFSSIYKLIFLIFKNNKKPH